MKLHKSHLVWDGEPDVFVSVNLHSYKVTARCGSAGGFREDYRQVNDRQLRRCCYRLESHCSIAILIKSSLLFTEV